MYLDEREYSGFFQKLFDQSTVKWKWSRDDEVDPFLKDAPNEASFIFSGFFFRGGGAGLGS